jgi:hypothetical protein
MGSPAAFSPLQLPVGVGFGMILLVQPNNSAGEESLFNPRMWPLKW